MQYHYSGIDKIDNKIELGDDLIFCPEHVHMADITYNEDKEEEIYLSETAKIIIVHIKMRQTDEIRRKILEELAGETVEAQSAAKDKVSLNSLW